MSEAASRTDVIAERAAALIAQNRVGAARPVLAGLARLGIAAGRLAELQAALLTAEGKDTEACAMLEGVLREDERAGGALWRELAACYGRLGRMRESAGAAAEAVCRDPADGHAKAYLGIALLGLGRFEAACDCLEEACRAHQAEPRYWRALAAAQTGRGQPDYAATALADGLVHLPGSCDLITEAVLLALQRGLPQAAYRYLEPPLVAGASDPLLLGLAAHALGELGRSGEAMAHLERARQVLAEAEIRMPPTYLAACGNHIAQRYEAEIIGQGYRVPGLLRQKVLAHRQGRGPILDAGCGTGLMGVALSDITTDAWHGIDIAQAMLAQAKRKTLYHRLIPGDCASVLAGCPERYDTIIAADLLCHFGGLETILGALRRSLTKHGKLYASLGHSSDLTEGWRLTEGNRFAHCLAYAECAIRASGLRVVSLERETLRYRNDIGVDGLILVAARHEH
jgi:predicted TPR repeat methyltransferase